MQDFKDIKLPPKDIEAEASVLSCIMLGGWDCLDKANEIIQTNDAFYDNKHKSIWKAMNRLRIEENQIEMISLCNEVKKESNNVTNYDISVLIGESAEPTTATIKHHAKIVWEKHVQREVARTAYKLYSASFESINTTRTILDEHGKYVDALRSILPGKEQNIGSVVDDTVDKIIAGNNMIPFNFKPLDESAGGMTRGEITVVGGRPGHGKTTLMITIIKHLIEDGKKVCLFNREMNNVEMMRKIFVMESENLTYDKLRKNEVDEKSKKVVQNGMAQLIKDKYKNLIMFDDVKTIEESMAEVTKIKPDVIIDDYIQLIGVAGSLERRFQIERIMTDYKWICKKENCSAILVSQLNREIERRFEPKPKLSDFAESGVIEQTAEAAVFVYYPYHLNDEEFSPYSSTLIIAKARYGITGENTLGFNGNRCKFYLSESKAMGDTLTVS